VGAGLYCVGSAHIDWGVTALQNGQLHGMMKVVAGLFVSPFFGFVIGFLVMKLFFLVLLRATEKVNKLFVVSQYVSVAWLGFSHGANDAQKGMAVIGMMLLASGVNSEFSIPVWAIFLCASAITLGTMFGGWRIIRTLGFGLFHVKIIHSVANQLSSALVNSIATLSGAPTSTTQVVTATLLGNGAAEKPQHVKWQTARGIVTGWFMNVPVSMFLGWLYCFLFLKLWG
jgi:PiT family inorganic phosphate transporter